jgi:hypothetical protein
MTVVDLSRRFRELTKSELEDSEALLSLANAGLLNPTLYRPVDRFRLLFTSFSSIV